MVRFAVAVRPPAAVLDRLRTFPRPAAPGVVRARPEQWIVHVPPLGHVDPALADPLLDALAGELDGALGPRCVLGPATVRLAGQCSRLPCPGRGGRHRAAERVSQSFGALLVRTLRAMSRPKVTSSRSATASSSTASIASPEILRRLPITS